MLELIWTGQNVCKHVAWSHCYSLKFIFLETIRNFCQACCAYDWYHLAQTNEASHHRVLRLHTFFVEYKQCRGSVPVSVAAQVTQSALTDTGANGTLLSSTGSIKISPQTAADPHHAAAFLTCAAAPAGARSADSANQFARLHPPPSLSLVCIIIHRKWWGFFISKFTRAHRPTAAADANGATVGRGKQNALRSVWFWLCTIIPGFAS